MEEYGADAKILFHHHSSDYGGGTQEGSTLTVPLQVKTNCNPDILLDAKELYELPNVMGHFLGANSVDASSSGISDCSEVYESYRTIMSHPGVIHDLCKPRVLEYSDACAEEMKIGMSDYMVDKISDVYNEDSQVITNITVHNCSDERNQSSAECICRDPMNWEKSICQDSYNSGRIIGGEEVLPNVYPWFARALWGSDWGGCGGSLVSPEYVLTSAHCVYGKINVLKSNGGYQIGTLCDPYSTDNNCGQKVEKYGVHEIYMHPNFDPDMFVNDFALVRLKGVSSITPVAMDDGGASPGYIRRSLLQDQLVDGWFWSDGIWLYISNWTISNKMDAKKMGIDRKHDVRHKWSLQGTSCGGDDGGPLFDSESKRLVGVVSWGYDCNPGIPSMYALISNQIYWIKTTICAAHSDQKPSFCGGSIRGGTSQSIIIDFDEENGDSTAPYYRSDIQLHNFWSTNASLNYYGYGFDYGAVSGPNVGFNGFAKPMDISCPDGSFSLQSLWMTPAYHNGLSVGLYAYVNRSLKASYTMTLSSITQPVKLESELSEFKNIDYLSIATSPSQVAVDDIAIEIISPCTVQPQVAAALLDHSDHYINEKLSTYESDRGDLAATNDAKPCCHGLYPKPLLHSR